MRPGDGDRFAQSESRTAVSVFMMNREPGKILTGNDAGKDERLPDISSVFKQQSN